MDVQSEEIKALLKYFSKNTYEGQDTDPTVRKVLQRCLGLFDLDYTYTVVPNPNTKGEVLCASYPSSLVILESEKGQEQNGHNGSGNGIASFFNVNQNGNGDCQNQPEERESSPSTPIGTPGNGIDLFSESFIISSQTLNGSLNGVTAHHVNQNNHCLTSTTSSISVSNSISSDCGVSDTKNWKALCKNARKARCRTRFPVSVILYNNKHICRSATLSGGPEIYTRSSFEYIMGGADPNQYNDTHSEDAEIVVPRTQKEWQLIDLYRNQDIRLLKYFQVKTIVDLMVENKKVKYYCYVTSSEKVDKENRYRDFTLISLPYPGCEFFKDFRDRGYNAEDLIFDWKQAYVDADISVPQNPITASVNAKWPQYKKWDLVTLTQKYLTLLLAYVRDGNKGLLVHCISGWDRTPLYISLLRLSLWADGVIHKSLSSEQILYLTIAYDWMLFGHDLKDRLSKGEEIMFFCFDFLKYIVDSEYSIEERCHVPTAKPQQLARARNDSDVQLDGVLLDGDGSVTSSEGSNWSLNSIGSSQSNKSHDNCPPKYFPMVQQESSWEDFNGAQYLNRHRHHSYAQNHSSSSNGFPSYSVASNGISPKVVEPILAGSDCGVRCSVGVNRTASASSINSNGSNGIHVRLNEKAHSALSLTSSTNNSPRSTSSSRQNLSMSSTSSLLSSENGNRSSHPIGRTSPVAVPVQNRTYHHNNRPESTSSTSASIGGSWQLITGTGSLREAISSTSDLGSASSHSHPSRLPVIGTTDCIEASESSCTLVEELTPVDCPTEPYSLLPHCSSKESVLTENEWKMCNKDEADGAGGSKDESVFVPSMSTPVNVTPTNNGLISLRKERLQTVRTLFYSLYASTIASQFRNGNDNSGGLGGLFENLATKVGIRPSNNRPNNL